MAPKDPVVDPSRNESSHAAFEESGTVLDLISTRARSRGQTIALTQGEERLTFEELEALSNRVARYLMRLGIGTGSRVALFMERNLRLPASILGILKTGASWMPLDPNYPAERLQYMIENCGAGLLFTERRLAGRFQTGSTSVCAADEVWEEICAQDPKPVAVPLSRSGIAYVIYTSGTTGKPKGVMIQHCNLANYVQSLGRAIGISQEDVYLHTASFGFSSSVRQLFLPLSWGAEVVVARSDQIADPLQLFGVIAKANVTIIDLVPTYWATCTAMLQGASELERRKLLDNHLRIVLSASEALWTEVPRRWRELFGSTVGLINMFGQTETCGIVTTYPIPASLGTDARIVPVGKPIARMRVEVLDAEGHPVPAGVTGEMYVGGADVGLGYVGLPDLTRERFVPDPSRPDGRLYRTGDLGRLMPSGDLEFLGRQDSQVKIRGQRIELAEIEAVLRSYLGVSEAAVVMRELEPGEQQLFAYFSERKGSSLELPALRDHLRRQLPEYMVPAVVLRLDRLPLTPSGKLDRKALPMPKPKSAEETAQAGAPADELERQLVQLWEEVLKRSPIGTRDDFFELGGHSLLAVRLFSRIEKLTGRKLPLATLFEARTIERLATLLRSTDWRARWKSLVPIKADGSKPPFYCVHGVGGNIVEFEDMSRHIAADQPLYGIQAQGLDGKSPRHKTVEEMASHYIKEIREFQPEGPYYLGGSSFGGIVALEMARRLLQQGQQVGLLAMFDTRAPGYPKWLPKTTALGRRLHLWRFRFHLHWSNLVVAKGAKLEYIKVKAVRLWDRRIKIWRNARRKVNATFEDWFHPRAIRDVRKAGHQASSGYQCQPYAGKVTLLRAAEQPHGICEDRTNGWSVYALSGIEVHDVPGHHGSIMREPRARILAETLTACLENAYKNAAAGNGS